MTAIIPQEQETAAETFEKARAMLAEQGLTIVDEDLSRPWGGFFVLDQAQIEKFAKLFFPDFDVEGTDLPLSPKLLMVAPGKRLSWQLHFRRAEIWKVLQGPIGVSLSQTDEEEKPQHFAPGEYIEIALGTRHRLIGLDDWGVMAEIWQHADQSQPSNEDDIIRLQDDFGR